MSSPPHDDQSLNCLHCGYDLRSAGEHGKCPECGRRFDRKELQATRTRSARDRRWLVNYGISFTCFGVVLLLAGWIPLYVYLWLSDRGRVSQSNLAGGFGPLAWCITPPALMFILLGCSMLVVWLFNRHVRN